MAAGPAHTMATRTGGATPGIRIVLFDVFDTLLQPTPAPHIQYAIEARAHGLRWGAGRERRDADGDEAEEDMGRAFKAAFKQTLADHPRYGIRTGLTDPAAWWTLLIKRTMQHLPQPNHARPLDDALPALTRALLNRFASAQAYTLFQDVVPTLQALRGITSQPRLALGVATNSDAAILHAMRDLGLGTYLNLSTRDTEAGQPGAPRHAQQEERPNPALDPPPTLSYAAPAEKPHAAFFHHAVQRAGLVLDLHPTPSTQSTETAAQQVLYVGDQLHEDYWGAKDAGLRALWLRRGRGRGRAASHQAVPGEAARPGRDGAEPGEEIAALSEVVDVVKASWGQL